MISLGPYAWNAVTGLALLLHSRVVNPFWFPFLAATLVAGRAGYLECLKESSFTSTNTSRGRCIKLKLGFELCTAVSYALLLNLTDYYWCRSYPGRGLISKNVTVVTCRQVISHTQQE